MYFHIPIYLWYTYFVIQSFVSRMAKHIKKYKDALFFNKE